MKLTKKEKAKIVKMLVAPAKKLIDCLGIYKDVCEKLMKKYPKDAKSFDDIPIYDKE